MSNTPLPHSGELDSKRDGNVLQFTRQGVGNARGGAASVAAGRQKSRLEGGFVT
ncbi:MAG: hypothetical protein ACTHL8_14065 [Burkholderiaceae bacterium]